MMKIVVCDDDRFVVERVAKECGYFFDKKKIKYNINQELSGENLLEEGKTEPIDLLIIDIDMPGMNGFEVVEQLQLLKRVETVIFITNQTHLVYDCFPYHPFEFIRKEMLEQELTRVLNRYWGNYIEGQKQCVFKVNGIERKITIADIVYIESRGHELYVNTMSEVIKFRSSFTDIENILGTESFIRLHHGYLVNAKFINLIGKCECQLKTNKIIPMSRHRREQVKSQFAQYLKERD